MKPYSQACENNKEPILQILRSAFSHSRKVLEIGSGTGQHSVHFAKHLPHLIWQTGDLVENHSGIKAWISESHLENVLSPIVTNVNLKDWEIDAVDSVFTANTLHIISWLEVEKLFEKVATLLDSEGVLCVYGPFNYDGAYTSSSNASFDEHLRTRDPLSGIRDFEAVEALAQAQGLLLQDDHPMPANNRCLVWKKIKEC
ncbi:MAG: DUF938 domain-containing protein [SAR324 cluster bacterium]|nr:DUF938 domain-containing protein [SAR324 cluster bacterium]